MHKKVALIGIFVSFAFIINLSFVFAQTATDTTPPTVSISTPPRSTPVSGSILIQARATDNVKIYGVNFYVDGQKVNYYEDRYAPFNAYFNTIKFQNGAHEVIAVARDTSNNYATSSPFVITASNRKSVVPALTVAPSYYYNGTTTSQRIANITAKLYGTAAGSANYYFYCNSAYSLSTSTSTEPDGKYLNVNSSAQIHKCSYPSSGTYYSKVIVERDGAVAQKRSVVSIRPPAPVIKFSVGDKIKVGGYTSTKVNVRSEPSLSSAIIGTQTYNSQGTVLEGPIYSGGYWWWKIDFNNGADGWAAGNYLVKVASQTTQTTIPTQTATPVTTTQPIFGTQITAIINTSNISPFSATINWMTNHPMDGQVEFGTSPCPCPNSTPVMSALSLNHAINLSNLTPATTYYYRVKSKDPNRNLHYTSENQTFTTTNSPSIIDTDTDGDGFADRIESFIGTDPKVACGANAWPADINDDGVIEIGDTILAIDKITSATVPYSKRHDFNTDGTVTGVDVEIINKYFGKSCVVAAQTPTTTSPLVISGIKIENPNNDPHSMSITWTTNKAANGQVEFDSGPCPCPNTTPTVTDFTTSHTINLFNLWAKQKYYYRIRSADASGNIATSEMQSFTTPAISVLFAPTEFTARALNMGAVALSWKTGQYGDVGIEIYRCMNSSTSSPCTLSQGNIVARRPSLHLQYEDTLLQPGASYIYGAAAYADGFVTNTGAIVRSTMVTAVATTPPNPLSAPTNMTATAVSSSQIKLSWTAPALAVTNYRILRCVGAECTPSTSYIYQNSSTTFTDNNLLPSTIYRYVVMAYGGGLISSPSLIAQATTPSASADTDGDSFGLVDDQGRLHFRDEVETFIGTDPAKACGVNAWPADINDDGVIEIGDTILISNNSQTSGAAYNKRYDFNMDGATNILDILRLNAYSNKSCSL